MILTIKDHRERVARYEKLKAEGKTIREIAELLGLSMTHVVSAVSYSRGIIGRTSMHRRYSEEMMQMAEHKRKLGASFVYIANEYNEQHPDNKINSKLFQQSWHRWFNRRQKELKNETR